MRDNLLELISQRCSSAEEHRLILPIPSKEAQSSKMKEVREVYQDAFKNSRTPERKKEFAAKLLEDGLDTVNDSAARYVLLGLANETAAMAGDIDGSLRCIDQLEAEYDVDQIVIRAEAFSSLSKTVHDQPGNALLLLHLNNLIKRSVSSDRYDVAKQMSALAMVSARKSRDLASLKRAQSQVAEVEAVEKEHMSAAEAIAKLKVSPADPDANVAVGRFLCFAKGDWDEGLPKLTMGNNQSLKEIAKGIIKGDGG